jgi:phospholipid-binding lipoprotein MlaA
MISAKLPGRTAGDLHGKPIGRIGLTALKTFPLIVFALALALPTGANADGTSMFAPTENTPVDAAPPPAGYSSDVYDPFEPVNRGIFAANEALDQIIVMPVATVYTTAVVAPIRDNLRSFLRNLRTPITLTNNVLQGDWAAAENTLARFFINSTLGLGGFADVASSAGRPYQSADFGQTLARWGAGPGPYIVLPLFGPSNVRDSIGTAVDIAGDPVSIVLMGQGAGDLSMGRTGLALIDARGRVLGEVEELRAGSGDY